MQVSWKVDKHMKYMFRYDIRVVDWFNSDTFDSLRKKGMVLMVPSFNRKSSRQSRSPVLTLLKQKRSFPNIFYEEMKDTRKVAVFLERTGTQAKCNEATTIHSSYEDSFFTSNVKVPTSLPSRLVRPHVQSSQVTWRMNTYYYWKFSLSVTFWKFRGFWISVEFFFWALPSFQITARHMKKVSELEAFILSCSVKSYRLAPLYLATFSGRWKWRPRRPPRMKKP